VSPRAPRGGPGAAHRLRRLGRIVATLVAAAVFGTGLLAACGGGSSSSSSGSSTTGASSTKTATTPIVTAPPNAEEGTVFVSLGSAAGLGQVLVDSEGHTLYAFSGDTAGAATCEGACERAWPPLLIEGGEPHPSNGTSAARLGTIERPDGERQVTYSGHPLYRFAGDKSPGQAKGDGDGAFGGTWTALKGNGTPAG
jgi:predicted lipoprotein with Yx(FWY)xxD motif